MHTYRNPMVVWMAVLVLAMGLAACGGGGGSPSPAAKAAAEQRTETIRLIETAQEEVLKLGGSTADPDFKPAEDAVAAATKALKDADALSASEKAELTVRIELLEANLATARKRVADALKAQQLRTAEEARKLTAALSGAPITAIGAALAHGEAPHMSGTVPGSPATAVSGLETVAAGGASTANGWQRGRYTASGDGTADRVALYTNIDPPGSRPFSGENGKYSADNGLDDDGNLPIAAETDTTLIVSAGFPAGPALRTHEPGPGGTVTVSGTFDGAPGAFICTPAAESACMSSIRDGGGYTLTGGGGWKFVPTAGALVPEPDGEYQYFGWWLREAGGAYAIGVFHGGEGGAEDELANLAALQGSATYSGPAVGKFAIQRPLGEAEAGDFTATAVLEADFGDATAPGTVEGEVNGFMVEGQAKDWSVALETAAIGTHGTIARGGVNTAFTRWTIGGVEADPAASWSGQFHDVDPDSTPSVATGRFDAAHGDTARISGAFGTVRQ